MNTEADTCRKYVVPKLLVTGWDNEPHSIAEQRTVTDGRVIPMGKEGFTRRPPKRVDYLLRYTRDFPLAVVEAQATYKAAAEGVQQARTFAEVLGLKFAYATNGTDIIEIDYFTGTEKRIHHFPKQEELWRRYRAGSEIPGRPQADQLLALLQRSWQVYSRNRFRPSHRRGGYRAPLSLTRGSWEATALMDMQMKPSRRVLRNCRKARADAMKIARLRIQNFRGIKEATIFFHGHTVLVGDNNVGKSTIFEAIDLALGPDRLGRHQKIDEHDFYRGDYLTPPDTPRKEIRVEVVVTELTEEQQNIFGDEIEWWNTTARALQEAPVQSIDQADVLPSIRVVFIGYYEPEDDDFAADTYFSRSLEEDESPAVFTKRNKQYCGFLYLRSLRTASRALSLEHGSLLDIILRLKEIRPQMWEKTINELSKFTVAADPELGISGVLESIDAALKRYVPREWGVSPHLKVSNLTRENLRKVISAFIATGDCDHAAPFYRQGTGTLNMLVLAMLSQIAADKQNVIFAMEEPETAIPPYTQKRIVHEVRNLASQSIFSSHSPYILEEFGTEEICVLIRGTDCVLRQASIELPASVKPKRYRQEFRTRFCEALLSRRVLLAEGATEAATFPAAARRLSELDPDTYASFEALGICTVDAGGDSQIADLSKLYGNLGKTVYAVCDQQTPANQATMEASVTKLFMHGEAGIESLVLKNTTQATLERFIDAIQWPPHLRTAYPNPKTNAIEALSEYFVWSKGNLGLAEFIAQCNEAEIPGWIRQMCCDLRDLCQPSASAAPPAPDPPQENEAVAEADLAGTV